MVPTRPAAFRPRSQPTRVILEREYEAKRRQAHPWRALYKTPQWQAIRLTVFADEPLCRRCRAEGLITPATVVNHVERHRGDPVKFFAGPFEPLCKPCHDGEVQREERAEADRAARTPSKGWGGRKSGA